LGLYIDGCPALAQGDEAPISTAGASDTGAAVVIGPSAGQLLASTVDILAISFYSGDIALEMAPQYARVAPDPGDADLLAAVDFASGAAQDISANGYAVSITAPWSLYDFTPAALFDGGSAAVQPDSADTVNPGDGAQPFTVMVRAIDGGAGLSGPLIANQGAAQEGGLSLTADGRAGQWQPTLSYVPAGGALTSHTLPVLASPDVAITYDGSGTITAYAGGEQCDLVSCGTLAAIPTPSFAIGAVVGVGPLPTTTAFTGGVQRVAVWTSCLSAAQIAEYTTTVDLSGAGCAFDTLLLYEEPGDFVTDLPLQVSGSVQFTEIAQPIAATNPAAAPRPAPAVSSSAEIALSSRPAMLALQAKLGSGAASAADAPLIEAGKASFETLIRDLPPAHQPGLRQRFATNLESSFRLAETEGSLPGQVSVCSTADEQQIWFQHPSQGRMLVASAPTAEVSKMVAWVAAMLLQTVVIVCDILMIGIIVGKAGTAILNAVKNSPGLLAKVQAVIAVQNELIDVQFAINVIKAVYQAGNLGNIFTASLANLKWWNWAFTVASAVISVCALFLTGGAYLAVVATLVALDIAKLVLLYKDRPNEGQSASPPS
jgi:hypothetical protein